VHDVLILAIKGVAGYRPGHARLRPRVGGILLGFPAIMAASLTLIAEEEDITEAREDARGAIVGACALALFAAVAALTFVHESGGVVLLISTVVWASVAVLGYVVLWWR
jgi:phosphotransferase system  glucose/maltose/N-acetylglucosamine-specific IIC component